MAKAVKTKWLGARVDDALSGRVALYIEQADGLDTAALIRVAIEEYLVNHPITEPIKQGQEA